MIHTIETHLSEEPNPSMLLLALPPARAGGEGSFLLLPVERAAEAMLHKHWHRKDVARFIPEQMSDTHIAVQVNDSRWIVQCPLCLGAQVASRSDRRFFCVDCLNAHVQGRWCLVDWPVEADDIEAELRKRPLPYTRAWKPGETVADLQRENIAHAVA